MVAQLFFILSFYLFRIFVAARLINDRVIALTNLKNKKMATNHIIKSALLFVLLIASSLTYGQQRNIVQRSPGERAQRQLQWMQKNLGITDDQNKKVYDILFSAAKQADGVKKEPAGEGKKAEMAQVLKTKNESLHTILTADQYQKLMAHQQEIKARAQQNARKTTGQ